MNNHAIGRFERNGGGRYKLVGRKISGKQLCSQYLHSFFVVPAQAQQRGHGWPLGGCTDEGGFFAVICEYRHPFQAGAGGKHPHIRLVHADHSRVPSFQIERIGARIGTKSQVLFIRTQRDVLAHKIAGRKQECWSARGIQRIQVRPAILVGQKDDSVSGGPVQVCPPVGVGHRAFQRTGRFPQAGGSAGSYIGRVEAPRAVPAGQQGVGRATSTRHPDKNNLFAIRRPARRRVVGKRRCDPLDGCGSIGEDTYEGVVAPVRNKEKGGTIGAPFQGFDRPPHLEHIFRRLNTIHGSRPNLSTFDKGNPFAVW